MDKKEKTGEKTEAEKMSEGMKNQIPFGGTVPASDPREFDSKIYLGETFSR